MESPYISDIQADYIHPMVIADQDYEKAMEELTGKVPPDGLDGFLYILTKEMIALKKKVKELEKKNDRAN